MINSPRAARSATLASISGATTVTTAPEPSSPRIAGSAAGPSAADQHRGPSNPRLAEKASRRNLHGRARLSLHSRSSSHRLARLLRKLQATNNDLLLGKLFAVGYALHIGLQDKLPAAFWLHRKAANSSIKANRQRDVDRLACIQVRG